MSIKKLLLSAALLMAAGAAHSQCANLVTNPDALAGFTGWSVSAGGSGLTTHPTEGFVHTFAWVTQTQTIDLATYYTPAQLATSPAIIFSQQVKGAGWSPCTGTWYQIVVRVKDASGNALQTLNTGQLQTASNSVWQTVAQTFNSYVGTPRYVQIDLMGKDCAYWAGQYGTVFNNTSVTTNLPTNVMTLTQSSNTTQTFDMGSCTQTGITLSTTTSNLGTVVAKTFIDASANVYNGQPYVRRHFDIHPSIQGPATVTLFVPQSDFAAYNAVRGSYSALPSSGDVNDPALANLSITAFHGVPAGGYDPANYPTGAAQHELIPNAAIAKVWNSAQSRWELTFNVTSFSGFFISTGTMPLRITSGVLAATSTATGNQLRWKVYSEAAGDRTEIQRSPDGRDFSTIGTVNADGIAGDHSFDDNSPLKGENYYRLKMVDGSTEALHYSNTVALKTLGAGRSSVHVFPNPASKTLTISMADGAGQKYTQAILLDATGKTIREMSLMQTVQTMDIHGIPAGIYHLKVQQPGGVETIKVVVQ